MWSQNEIIEMAIEAGWHGGEARSSADALKTFAEILAARLVPQERETCAKLCDEARAARLAEVIRARGK